MSEEIEVRLARLEERQKANREMMQGEFSDLKNGLGRLEDLLKTQNGRIGKTEKDIRSLELSRAKFLGIAAGAGAVGGGILSAGWAKVCKWFQV